MKSGISPAPGLGVETLAVAPLALLQRGRHVDQHEVAAGVLDHRPHLPAGRRRTARSGEQIATPPCREISAATQPMRRMLVSRSSREKVSPATRLRRTTSPSRLVTVRSPRLEQVVHDGPGQGRLAAAGEPGEEEHHAPLAGRRTVEVDDRGDLVAQRRLVVPGVLGEPEDRVGAGVRRQHLHAEGVVGLGVAVRRQGYGDHGRVLEPRGRGERGPQQPDRRQRRRAVADQGDEDDPTLERAQPGDLVLVEGVGDRHERGAGVGGPRPAPGSGRGGGRARAGRGSARRRPRRRPPRRAGGPPGPRAPPGSRRPARPAGST